MGFSFVSVDFQNALDRLFNTAQKNLDSKDAEIKKWAEKVRSIKFLFTDHNIKFWDENLYETKKWDLFDLSQLNQDIVADELMHLKYGAVSFFVYLKEWIFRLGVRDGAELNRSIRIFYDFIYTEKNQKYLEFKTHYDFVDELPFVICGEIYSNSKLNEIRKFLEEKDFSTFRAYSEKNEEVQSYILKWESELPAKIEEVNRIKTSLKSYEDAFNFVGIFDGFNKLHSKKVSELRSARIGMILIAVLIICLIGYELDQVNNLLAIPNQTFDVVKVIVLTIPLSLLTFILLYFFRIILQTMRSLQSQLLQLDLRLTLCRFIQSYAESASGLKGMHPDGFEKFESLIFSPLVSSDQKIPNAFDGLDQLSSVVNIVKGKD